MRHFGSIYNSKHGALFLTYSNRGTASMQFVPVYKPVSPSEITKGMKVYNYDEAEYFSLTPEEATILIDIIEKWPNADFNLGSIQYVGSKSNNKTVTITHFPGTKEEKKTRDAVYTKFLLAKTDDNKVIFQFISNKNGNKKIGVPCTLIELKLFKRFLENLFTFIATLNALSAMDYIKQQNRGHGNQNQDQEVSSSYFSDDSSTNLDELVTEFTEEENDRNDSSISGLL